MSYSSNHVMVNKMTDTLQMTFSKAFLKRMFASWFLSNFVLKGPTYDKLTVKHLIAWCRYQVITWTKVDQDIWRHWGSLISINTLGPRQNGRHFPDDIFKCIFLNENIWISIKFSLKFVPKGTINNIAALVQMMAWCLLGDKPLSEAMMVYFIDAYMRH